MKIVSTPNAEAGAFMEGAQEPGAEDDDEDELEEEDDEDEGSSDDSDDWFIEK